MKKLFLWSVLLMTGFAFYSCDDVIDNPAGGKQDPSNPNATWTYEVSIKFVDFSFWHNDANWNWVNTDIDGEEVTYKAPSTVYVHNKAGEFLGELKAVEEFDYKNFDFNSYYKFAGTLTGAIGEELVISTLKDFDYYSKQDGTLKTLAENCMLATAEVPIIVTDNNRKKIATQNVKLESAILPIFARFYSNHTDDTDRSFTLTADSLIATPSFEVKFAEAVKPQTEGFFFAFAPSAKESAKYNFEFNSEEKGIKGINVWEDEYKGLTSVQSVWGLNFNPKEIDLSKYTKYLKDVKEQEAPYYISTTADQNAAFEPLIYQSSKDTVEVRLTIYGKATIKDLVFGKSSYVYLRGNKAVYEAYNPVGGYNELPVITVLGENSITSTYYNGIYVYSEATLKGDGTLKTESNYNGISISNSYWDEIADKNWNWTSLKKPAKLIVTENVKLISNSLVAINSVWINSESFANELVLKGGSLEAKGKEGQFAIALWGGKLNIGEGTSVKATTGMTGDGAICIYDQATSAEATIESLVADKTKFTDETKDGVRTIK